MKTPFHELVKLTNRITGFSIPIFGISWNPPTMEVEIAERFITFLEDRRVLYTSPKYEIFGMAVHSIREIRKRIVDDLEVLIRSSNLADLLREMNSACHIFLSEVEKMESDDVDEVGFSHSKKGSVRRQFFIALVTFRRACAILIAQISVTYGIDLQPQLVKMIKEYGGLQYEYIERRSQREIRRLGSLDSK